MRLLRRTLGGAVVAATIAVSISSVSLADTTLNFAPAADLQVLDPVVSSASITKNHGYMVYDTLFGVDEDDVVHPQMLESYEISDDRLNYSFELRTGLKWHDGAPVTSADVVASLNRWASRDGTAAILFNRIESIQATGERTFEFKLNEPFGAAIDVLAKSAGRIPFIMPKRVAETDARKQITEHIGSGPFVFVADEWVPGNRVVYQKFQDYVPRKEPPSGTAGGKAVKVDRVIWKVLPDKQTAISALLAGEIDYMAGVPIDLLPVLDADPNIKLVNLNDTGWYGYLVPNHSQPPFNTPKGREALAWLIDQEQYMQAMVGLPGQSQTCASMFTCGTPMSTEASAEAIAGVDVEKAKKLFKEAGWDSTEPIVILDATDDEHVHAAALMTAQLLRGAGLKADVQAMDWATLSKRRKSTKPTADGGWNIFVTYGSGLSKNNPLFHSSYSANCQKTWWSHSCDPELEKTRSDWASATSLEEQKAAAVAYQEQAYSAYSPWFPLGQWRRPLAARSNVAGILKSGTYQAFWNIEKN